MDVHEDTGSGKPALRRSVLLRRAAADPAELAAAAAAITARVLEQPAVRAARTVAAYASIGTEVATGELIDALQRRGVLVLLPVLEPDSSLSWRAHLSGSELVAGRYGLLEPAAGAARHDLATADVLIVPAVAFDTAGNRLGRGGGSYDRSLQDLPASVVTVGLALDSDVVDRVPVDPHDRPVRMIVTPTRVITPDGSE